jgi:hypothetical protein
MISKLKIALIAALAVSAASPAFAQTYKDSDGNQVTWSAGAPQYEQPAARQNGRDRVAVRQNRQSHVATVPGSGLYDYAATPFAPGGNASSNSPALTGGGSTGYNTMVLTY